MDRRRRCQRLTAHLACLGLWLVGGCSDADAGPPPQERDLIVPDTWELTDPERDVFADLRPADATCDPEEGFGPDELGGAPAFEINTGRCNYITVSQRSLVDIGRGDPMKLSLWHFELFSLDDAEAFVALAVEGEEVWSQTIAIPGPAELVVAEWESTVDAAAGAELQFHLNNHGINSWNLLTITVTN